MEEAQTSNDFELVDDLDVPLLLVDPPEAEVLLSAHANEGLRLRQVPDHLDGLSMHREPAVKLVQLLDMHQIDGALAHSESKKLLECINRAPDVADSCQVQPLVEDLSIEGWYVLLALCSNELHRCDLLHHHRLIFSVSELALLQDLLQESSLSVNLVDAERAIRQQDDDSIQSNGVLHGRDLLGAWRRIEGAFVLLSNPLDEGTVVIANTHCESNSMISVCFEALKSCLNLLNLGVDSQVVLQDEVDGVRGHSASLCHKNSLAILIEANV